MLQAISSLGGSTSLRWVPGLGGFFDVYASIQVIFYAAQLFYEQPALVSGLFILIAIAWVVQGGLMFSRLQKEPYARPTAAGAVILTGVLYLFLFIGLW